MKVTEYFLRPQIDAAFTRVTVSQLNHRNPLRPEKKHQRNNPQPDGDAAIGRNARNHIQIENCNDEQRDEVPTAEGPLQVRDFTFRSYFVCQKRLLSNFSIAAEKQFVE
jgi:hypothetical protein